ncbi:phosphoglucosamine mutase [Irregularibacter muris]|uniref:Phosphoglucosamine mutase n=1 Tax=Irregularibacter muris TaxID=1796619 RepID=A0AAE3KZE8_9FIRM|nr:phosphoglucosamine mutase [Irregularibacter muris]MCR1898621.1 phosphoglucosamine mutase [Irregularibacter muris]
MGRLFGTDGVRGVANKELTAPLAYQLGQAGAHVLKNGNKAPKIVVGSDTRISGDMLETALISGICSVGGEALCVGVVPTPVVAFLTRYFKADAGVVISASHNPVEFNGIKFFNYEGYKLPDEIEDRIEKIILDRSEEILQPIGNEIGKKTTIENADDLYIEFLKKTIDVDFKGFKIALDCANGAAYRVAPRIFEELGAQVEAIHYHPDGTNINRKCGSTHPEDLQKLVVEKQCDLGLAFDGDADRLIAVDHKGEIVDGDKILVICGLDLKDKDKLKDNTLVVTVMSNLGLDKALQENDCKFIKTSVGDRYVLEAMLKDGYSLGGEQSGHVIFLDHNTTGDGLLTALQLTMVLKHKNKSLRELASVMKVYPQVLVNAKVSNSKKYDYMNDSVIQEEIKKVEDHFHGKGRVLIRPSGTEPLVRVMIEGEKQEELDQIAKDLASLIEERLQ